MRLILSRSQLTQALERSPGPDERFVVVSLFTPGFTSVEPLSAVLQRQTSLTTRAVEKSCTKRSEGRVPSVASRVPSVAVVQKNPDC